MCHTYIYVIKAHVSSSELQRQTQSLRLSDSVLRALLVLLRAGALVEIVFLLLSPVSCVLGAGELQSAIKLYAKRNGCQHQSLGWC